jgi:hypothetical protein
MTNSVKQLDRLLPQERTFAEAHKRKAIKGWRY